MEPETLKNWLKTKRLIARVGDPDRVRSNIKYRLELSSQDFDLAKPTLEFYEPGPNGGAVYVAYDPQTHRGVMREHIALMHG